MLSIRQERFRPRRSVLLIAMVVLCCGLWPSVGYAIAYDLRADWSNLANPNGVWSYNTGAAPLPYTASWTGDLFSAPQPGWGGTVPFSTLVPVWFQSAATPLSIPGFDWQIGDVVVHTQDEINGPGLGPANVTWTSPLSGAIDISGAAWMGRDAGRADQWSVLVRNALVSQGDISSGDPYSRASPFDFAAGSGGAGALQNIPVSAGDLVELRVTRTTVFGDYVGVNFTIQATPSGPGGGGGGGSGSSGVSDTSSTGALLGIGMAALSRGGRVQRRLTRRSSVPVAKRVL